MSCFFTQNPQEPFKSNGYPFTMKEVGNLQSVFFSSQRNLKVFLDMDSFMSSERVEMNESFLFIFLGIFFSSK